MNTQHTHTTTLVVRQSDVAIDLVAKVAKSAIEPLAGEAFVRISDEHRIDVRTVRLRFWFFAANDREALRTAQVLRSTILPLVRGCTITGTHPIRAAAMR